MIVAIDGKDIKSMDQAVEDIESKAVGRTVELTIIRDKKRKVIKVNLAEMPLRR